MNKRLKTRLMKMTPGEIYLFAEPSRTATKYAIMGRTPPPLVVISLHQFMKMNFTLH